MKIGPRQQIVAPLIVVLLFSVAMSGCRRESAQSSDGDAFRVAIVVPGTTADQGWNYSAKEAAAAIEKELQLDQPVSFVENVEASKRKALLRDFGRDGFDLVICHGYEFHQDVKEVASDFPGTTFVISGYDQPDERFGSIVYELGEGAYLCGILAAQVTETNCVGFIAAMPTPPVVLCFKGFQNGFLHGRPGGIVRNAVYIEGTRPWEDSAAAKSKTQAMLRETDPGTIDVLFQNADAASRGIFEAVEQQPGRVFVFGANRDQNATTATKRVLASAVIHVDKAFVRVAKAARDGSYQPHVESETVGSGVIDCVINPKLSDLVGEEAASKCREAVEEARQRLTAGEVDPYVG